MARRLQVGSPRRPKTFMNKLLQLVLALLLVFGLYAHNWWTVPFVSTFRQAFSEEELRKFYDLDKTHKIERRNKIIFLNMFRTYGCDGAGWEDISHYTPHYLQNLPPRLVAAVIVVESSCRAEAISPSGAVGLMQIMPSVHHLSKKELLDPERNIQEGTRILAQYIRETGSTREGLKRYFGMFEGDDEYADKILTIARMN
jgi:soluble lytic murein transglycosylase-like protein